MGLTGLLATTILLWPSPAAAAGDLPQPVASVEGITAYALDNGLEVLLFPDPSKPTVTVNVTYKVGSRHEGRGEAGMAHLLEHMVFKGTPTHPNIWAKYRTAITATGKATATVTPAARADTISEFLTASHWKSSGSPAETPRYTQ